MPLGYADDLSPREAWQHLAEDEAAVLIDVRTRAEWNYVGLPDLSGLGRPVFRIEWQGFPDGALNPNFVAEVEAAGIGRERAVLLICRSGVRSAAAAQLLTARGWQHCYNVADGFEGPHDALKHRGTLAGWKHDGLPWVQG
jgi:rhodanese-related sulfurtransferase